MFGFLKKNKKNNTDDETDKVSSKSDKEIATDDTPSEPTVTTKKQGLFQQLKQGLKKTRRQLTQNISNLLLGKKSIDEELLEEIESQLLMADMGVETTQQIIQSLTDRLERKQLNDVESLFKALNTLLIDILTPCQQDFVPQADGPTVILMVGVNGAGKTTTIGKIAKHYQSQGKKVMLAAGDTFRAAAVEQLKVWGERNAIDVIAQPGGTDSASVLYDAMQAAKARHVDILLADTAGRLHTQANLMQELQKVIRVIKKIDNTAPHETMLVLDASLGQNTLHQAIEFHQAVNVSGLTITKLDGTAKGGIIFAIANKLALPIRYIGVGEGIDDLKTFDAKAFTEALLSTDEVTPPVAND